MIDAAVNQRRRLNPGMIETDWLVLRDLRTAILSLMPRIANTGTIALDYGCGSKPYETMFTSMGVRYVGADFDGHGDLTIAPSGHLQAQDKSSDLVLSFQVLEHVRDLNTYFAEAKRVLRPDGWLMLSTHGTWFYHPHPEDHRRWTRQGLISEVTDHGFHVVECIPVVGPIAWTTIIRLTCACHVLRKIPLVGSAIGGLLAIVMNLRAMIEEAITPRWVKDDNACVYLILARPATETGS
jgi:SAM-dependent methyltransferase